MESSKPSDYKNTNSSECKLPKTSEETSEETCEETCDKETFCDIKQTYYVVTKHNKPFKVFTDFKTCDTFMWDYSYDLYLKNGSFDTDIDILKDDNSVYVVSRANFHILSYDTELLRLTWYKV